MAFTGNYSCNTLRTGLMNGNINFTSDTFYLALYTNDATLDQTTTAYTTTGEASGGNYAAGGQVVTATVSSQTTASGSVVVRYIHSPSMDWSDYCPWCFDLQSRSKWRNLCFRFW
jgi:hypothetical protein